MEIQPFALTQDGAAVNMSLVEYIGVVDDKVVEARMTSGVAIEMVRCRNRDEADRYIDNIFIQGGVVNFRDNHPAAAWGKQPKK